MIKNIIFDIGNVLSDFRWREFLLDKGFSEEMVERIRQASVLTDSWYEFDKGVFSDEEVIELFIKNDPDIAKEIHLAFDNVEGMVRLKHDTFDLLRSLKSRGYKLYYLSNYSHKAEVQCPEATSFIPEMDGGIQEFRSGSSGFPILGVTVAAFDTDTNAELKYYDRGEIRILTPVRMKEYYKRQKATEDFFWTDDKGNKWGKTGDIGYVDEDGFVFILGRTVDFFIPMSGQKVYCFDIERVLLQNKAIHQCEVVGILDGSG